jgi:outer membrane receptor protein involved in Fe transport
LGAEVYLAWMPTRGPVTMQLAYTYSHFQYTNDTSAYGDLRNHWLPNSPESQLMVDGQVRLARDLTVGATSETLSRWYVDPTNGTSVDGYTLLHARLAYQLRVGGTRFEATASVRNILGKEYIAFSEPDPDGNSYQPAAEREVFVGLRVTP